MVKQTVGGAKENSKIMAIPNLYKDSLDNLIDSSNTKSTDWPKPINKGSRNAVKSEDSLTGLLEWNCLDKDISDRSSKLAPKTEDF